MFTKQKSMTLSECYEAIANKELINDNHIFTSLDAFGYVVTHYNTPIAAFIRGRWYRTKTFYSNTTSRVLNGIFSVIEEDTIDVTENDLSTLIKGGSL